MRTILISEDEPDAQESLKNILKAKDYAVYTAKDGAEAIDVAKEINPDLVLLDIRMPKVDGLEVAREGRKFNSQTKIIFITAFQSPELVKEALKTELLAVSLEHLLWERFQYYHSEDDALPHK